MQKLQSSTKQSSVPRIVLLRNLKYDIPHLEEEHEFFMSFMGSSAETNEQREDSAPPEVSTEIHILRCKGATSVCVIHMHSDKKLRPRIKVFGEQPIPEQFKQVLDIPVYVKHHRMARRPMYGRA